MALTEITIILAPLSFLPGIGLLILSTSRRYIELIRQLQHIMDTKQNHSTDFMLLQRKRLWMFKWAMSLLYLCVGFVLIGSLAAGFSIHQQKFSLIILYTFLILAVFSATTAIIILIKESFVSASLINEQLNRDGKPGTDNF